MSHKPVSKTDRSLQPASKDYVVGRVHLQVESFSQKSEKLSAYFGTCPNRMK